MPHHDEAPCAKGCGAQAVVRFVSKQRSANGSYDWANVRNIALCEPCAVQLREKLKLEPVPPQPPAPTDPMETAAPPKRPAIKFPIPEGAEVTSCRTCGESVIWVLTRNDKRMPVEAFGEERGESHFIRCKQADQHRRPRQKVGRR
jgi:hypothetical protein